MQGHIWYQMKAYDLRCTIWNVVKTFSGAYNVKFDVEMTSSKCLKILIFWMKIYVLIICTEMWQFHLQNRNSLDLFLIYKSFKVIFIHTQRQFLIKTSILTSIFWRYFTSEFRFGICYVLKDLWLVSMLLQTFLFRYTIKYLLHVQWRKKCFSGPF